MKALFTHEGVDYDALDILQKQASSVCCCPSEEGWTVGVIWDGKPGMAGQTAPEAYEGSTLAEALEIAVTSHLT